MIKKAALTALAIILLLGMLAPVPLRAAGGLTVLTTSAVMDFPASITFKITAGSDAAITDVRLNYVVERMEHARITSEIYVGVEPATSVATQWVWDMRKTGGLPPGSSVAYWWTVSDASGKNVKTALARVQIEDNRYNWMGITEGKVTLYWYRGNDFFVQELMTATRAALDRLSDITGAELESPVRIYIYASAQDLRGSMIYPQDWTGGVAFTRYSIIALGIAPNLNDLAWGKRVIAHELTHLVIHQVTFSPYGELPTWLDEGLAMVAEGPLESTFVTALYKARTDGQLISVRSLASPFSAYADESILAYAQSQQLVKYLIDEYGREKMLKLLMTFHQGSGYDQAMKTVYGFDMDGLDAQWWASFKEGLVR
ncbi:MAG: peptidase MA family metallohydrolase [Chloroflexota bacterium]